MALTAQQISDIESAMMDFMERHRPPAEIREKVDLGHRIEGQSVVIYEIRPCWRGESQKIEEHDAKATYVRKTNRWNINWQRADLKWHSYPPHPEAVFFDEFLAVVGEDENCCFWG